MARRHITLVLELDGEGNPVEINRAWSEDEVPLPTGGLGMTPKVNVDEASLAGLLPDLAGVTAQLVAAQDARDAAITAKDEALAAKAAAEADRDQNVTAAEASLTGRDETIASLEAQIAELTAVPERSIHKAYLRAALASIERLAEVDAVVQSAGAVKWELWANATTISQDDADVNAIADVLGIDLDAVFVAARAIRAARGG